MKGRVTPGDVLAMKRRGEKIAALTAYDRPTAEVCEAAGVEVILVGDSLGNVVLGYESTVPVTMDEMLHHVKAVTRTASRALVVADLPFLSYQIDDAEAMRNAGRFLKEGGAQAVKLEGGRRSASTVARLVEAGIPVMGHIGYTPQSALAFGRNVVQGRDSDAARALVEDAMALESAGCFALVLECVPDEVSRVISRRLTVPTIGIGAGADCDGQILVFHDMVGLGDGPSLKFVKRFAELNAILKGAVSAYVEEVKSGAFPSEAQTFRMTPEETERFARETNKL
jgi:3-methyl-2-oxobutanoate hydroxymethyltransferase